MAVAARAVSQMRLPAPLGAPPPSGKGGPSVMFIVLVLLVLALFAGAALFGLMYFVHEML